jgi:hypothetical protein
MNLKSSNRLGVLWLALSLMPLFTDAQTPSLFDDESLLEITLSGDLTSLFKDREGEPQNFDIQLMYVDSEQKPVTIPLKSKTRGKFRRSMGHCEFPPIFLNFAKGSVKNTLFENQDKLKLVMPCKGDKYVLNEYYAYKIYNLISDYSFKVKLLKINLQDSDPKAKQKDPFYAFLIEEEDLMAERNNMVPVKEELIRPEDLNPPEFLNMAIFQYMIANTDWSVQYRQNIKLVKDPITGRLVGVPYDFDHAGIVGAPYAKPAEQLEMVSVRERRYRGYCIEDMEVFNDVFELYQSKKEEIYSVYTSSPYLDPKYAKSTLKYLDDFYKILSQPKYAKIEMQYPCLEDGTGHVVIRGLKK